jgi:hypothetical protein
VFRIVLLLTCCISTEPCRLGGSPPERVVKNCSDVFFVFFSFHRALENVESNKKKKIEFCAVLISRPDDWDQISKAGRNRGGVLERKKKMEHSASLIAFVEPTIELV